MGSRRHVSLRAPVLEEGSWPPGELNGEVRNDTRGLASFQNGVLASGRLYSLSNAV